MRQAPVPHALRRRLTLLALILAAAWPGRAAVAQNLDREGAGTLFEGTTTVQVTGPGIGWQNPNIWGTTAGIRTAPAMSGAPPMPTSSTSAGPPTTWRPALSWYDRSTQRDIAFQLDGTRLFPDILFQSMVLDVDGDRSAFILRHGRHGDGHLAAPPTATTARRSSCTQHRALDRRRHRRIPPVRDL